LTANALVAPGQAANVTDLPSEFEWRSTGPLVGPKNDARNISGIKDPSIIQYNGAYHVFASTAQQSGYSLVYFNFTNPNKAGQADFYYLDQSGIGTGYRAAPEVFYFEPQKLWYLVYQNGNAAYSTNPDISNPAGWSAPSTFYAAQPKIITKNIGTGYWVDMWVICDAKDCYLYSSDDDGHLYRSKTKLADFPNGFAHTRIELSSEDNIYALFEASNVYFTGEEYLLIVEAVGATGERYFRSWTAPTLNAGWTPLADTEANPFAGQANVKFPKGNWTNSISHGEAIRTNVDQTLTIDPCNLRYLYQGIGKYRSVRSTKHKTSLTLLNRSSQEQW